MTQGSALPGDRVLLDTDVFSYLLKGREHAERYRKHVAGNTVAISFVTVGEIAACAIHHTLPLVTNNAAHFRGITGLTVITESASPRQPKSGDLFT